MISDWPGHSGFLDISRVNIPLLSHRQPAAPWRVALLLACSLYSGSSVLAADDGVALNLSPTLQSPPPVQVPADAATVVGSDTATAPAEGAGLTTLAQVIERVWRDNPQVRQAQLGVEAAGFDIRAARTGYLPYAQLQSSIGEQGGENSFSTLYFVQPLWSGGSTVAEVDGAKAKQRAAIAELERTRQDVGLRALDAFLAVALTQQQVVQWANYVAALKKLLDRVQRRADEGVAPQSDVQTALSRLRQAQAGAEANRGQLIAARAQLASLMLVTPGALEWPDDPYMLSDEQIAKATEQVPSNPLRVAADAQVDIQKASARASKAALWPSLSLQYRRQIEGLEFDPSNNGVILALQFQTSNGLRGFIGAQAGEQRVEAAKASADAVNQQVIATIKVDQAQLNAASLQLLVQQQATDAANSLVDSYLRQFDVGRRSWLDVLNVQREAHEYMLQSIALKRSYWYYNGKLALDAMYWNRLVPSLTPVSMDGGETPN